MPELEVTDSWSKKTYEFELTEFYFKSLTVLTRAQAAPVIENLRAALSAVHAFAYGLIYKKYLSNFKEKVQPVLKDIEKIIYGVSDSPEVMNLCARYGVQIVSDRTGRKKTITNIQNLLHELWEIFFLVKQWAYEEGFFAKKPIERKFGKEAMEDVFNM